MLEKQVENKYALEAPTFECRACESEIERGVRYFSAVLFEEDVFVRSEFCTPCWNEQPCGRKQDEIFAYWRTSRPVPETGPQKRRRFDIEILWGFFGKLREDVYGSPDRDDGDADARPVTAAELEARDREREEKARILFLLTLLLVRGKKLTLLGTAVRDGHEWLRLGEKGGDPDVVHVVRDPKIEREDLERVKETLGDLLQMDI